MNLSIIILSWNTRPLLLDCLRSVTESVKSSPPQTEVLVVDNASEDGSAKAVRDAFPGVRVIENSQNLGFAAGNNIGLKFATGKYCLLLNSDALVPPVALNELTAVMERSPETAVCSPMLLNGDGSAQICWARFPGARSELTGMLDRSQSPYPLADFEDLDLRASMHPFAVDWVGGACYLVRAEAIAQAGPLDERFFMYGEETEWCHRFARHGWQTLLVPAVSATHLGGQSAKAVPSETRKQMYRSAVRLYRTLYGFPGALLPCAITSGRFWLSLLRAWYRRRRAAEPIQ